MKRKAPTAKDPAQKKPRVGHHESEEDFDLTSPSDTHTSSDESQDEKIQARTPSQTPLTPISNANSPKINPSNRKTIQCTFSGCEKTFNRQAKLIQHLNSHTDTRPFVCPHAPCTKAFFRSSHLKHHVKSAHTDKRDYVCEWERCGKSFVTGTRLKRHREQHVKRQVFACTFTACGQEFRKHNTLQKHIAIVHEGKRKPFVCDHQDQNGTTCGASFDIEGNLKTHVTSVHSGRNYSCTICSADDTCFPTLHSLQAHIRISHPPKCRECDRNFSSLEMLERHIEAKHSNLDIDQRKKFACLEPQCGRSFTSKSNLKKHVRHIHEEAMSFVCGMIDPKTLNHVANWDGSNACGRALSSKYNLIGHIRTVHLGLGRLRRSVGEEKAPCSGDEALMRLTGVGYEGGREIECSIQGCAHRFPREYDLQRHLHSQHGLEMSDIDQYDGTLDRLSQASSREVSKSMFDTRNAEADYDGELLTGSFEDYLEHLEGQAATGE